jgi:predicted proteasome-type protease
MSLFGFISLGASLLGGISQKKAAGNAAAAAQRAAEFNAELIERDIGLLEKQRETINRNFLIEGQRAARFFERDVQGGVRAGFGYAGIDMSQGTPLDVLRENAREFEYERTVAQMNNEITNMQISDNQETARLNAELARMEGGAQAAGLRAQGTQSLIRSIGSAAQQAYEFF